MIAQPVMLGKASPLLPDVGVMAFVPEAWGGPWQVRHHVLTRLSRYFHVLWIDPSQEWRTVWFDRRCSPEVHGQADGREGLIIQRQEFWLPRFYRPRCLSRLTERARARRGAGLLRSAGCTKTVVYLWRPEYADVLTTVPHDASVYHIDDEYSFAPVEQELDAREAAVIAGVDQVFVHSRALLQKKGHLNPQTLYVPNGVDYAAYAARQDEPIDLRAIPHPRIGYVGKIKTQMDFPLLLSLAKRHRQWSWVFVGPIGFLGEDASRCEELFRLENVFYLGAKPISSLPAYTQHIDVCLLCYVVNDYTKYIYPLKLHEYLAGGRPVVGTTLPALEEFRSAVRLCTTDDEWSDAIADALAPAANRPQQVELRRTIARSHDWGLLVSRIARSLCERLGADYLRRFDQLSPITGLRDDSYPSTVHQAG